VEREAVLVGIDVGTSKVCALIGEVGRDGRLTIMGHGTVPASGLKKGVVVNIDQTVRSIADAVERSERLSGWKIDRAFVGVGGQHVESLNSTGQVAVTAHHREVTREDINRAIEVARAVSIPSNRDVLHVERRGFTVDGQEGVKDPLGMSALRLEVEAHIVSASATAVQNLTKCVQLAGVKIDELVVDGLASAEAVLTETEKELGVAVADIGAGTIDVALFADGSPFHTSVLPVGGNNVTNDVAIGVKTTLQVAEELKVRHGTCDIRNLTDEEISVSVLGEDAGRTVSREELCRIIEARMRETFELLRQEMTRSGHGMLPAGVILTGGGAQLAGTAELGREVLQMPVRVAGPSGIGGLIDTIQGPSFSTSVGLLRWGANVITADEPLRYESAPERATTPSDDRSIRPTPGTAGCVTAARGARAITGGQRGAPARDRPS
jgi:cell division protein FtsA